MNTLAAMVRLIEELAIMRTPVVFKGAMVLKTAVKDIPLNTARETRDIDMNWVGSLPSMDDLEDVINEALRRVDSRLVAYQHRKYEGEKSAGFWVKRTDIQGKGKKQEVFSLDIKIESNQYCQIYESIIKGVKFMGSSPDKMLADKVESTSNRLILRRMKDIYDLYLLSSLVGYRTFDVHCMYRDLGKKLGPFYQFREELDKIEYAYNTLKRIDNKPTFDVVYPRVFRFIYPFMDGSYVYNLIWDGNSWIHIK